MGERQRRQRHGVDGAQSYALRPAAWRMAGATAVAANAAAGDGSLALAAGPASPPAPCAVSRQRSSAYVKGWRLATRPPHAAGIGAWLRRAGRLSGTASRRVRRAGGQSSAQPSGAAAAACAPPRTVQGHAPGVRRGSAIRVARSGDGEGSRQAARPRGGAKTDRSRSGAGRWRERSPGGLAARCAIFRTAGPPHAASESRYNNPRHGSSASCATSRRRLRESFGERSGDPALPEGGTRFRESRAR